MKVLSILGTRPELIRLSRIIPKLDQYTEHIIVHTGQNHDYNLDGIFRSELGIREPNYRLKATGSFAEQLAVILPELEKIILAEKPDAFLVLGDTNSSMGAIVAKRLGVRIFHMEAGNRCHDPKSPEEVNRRIIDHSTDIHMPYTELSRANLLREGIAPQNIFLTGNPIKEVIDHYTKDDTPGTGDYYLVTLHRQENVDDPVRLAKFVDAINKLKHNVIWPMHPRTRKQLKTKLGKHVLDVEPMGFKKFIDAERHALCVLTDSGTVQEECAIFGTPCVTLRDSTERPETIEAGSNIITGTERILEAVKMATDLRPKSAPEEYFYDDVSDRVLKIITGYYK